MQRGRGNWRYGCVLCHMNAFIHPSIHSSIHSFIHPFIPLPHSTSLTHFPSAIHSFTQTNTHPTPHLYIKRLKSSSTISKTHAHSASSNSPKTSPSRYHIQLAPPRLIGQRHVPLPRAVSPNPAPHFPRESAKSPDPARPDLQRIGAHLLPPVPIPIPRNTSNTNTHTTFSHFPRESTHSEYYSPTEATKASATAEYSAVSPISEPITAVSALNVPRFSRPWGSSTGERPFSWRWRCCSTNSETKIRRRTR